MEHSPIKQLILSQLVDDISFYLETRISLLHTKQPAIGPYTLQDESNQYSPIPFRNTF